MTQSDDKKNDTKNLHKLTTQIVEAKWIQKEMIKCDDTKWLKLVWWKNGTV